MFAILTLNSVQAASFGEIVSMIVDPFTGAFHGGTDWIVNQFGLVLFQGLLHICLTYT